MTVRRTTKVSVLGYFQMVVVVPVSGFHDRKGLQLQIDKQPIDYRNIQIDSINYITTQISNCLENSLSLYIYTHVSIYVLRRRKNWRRTARVLARTLKLVNFNCGPQLAQNLKFEIEGLKCCIGR